MVHSSYVVSEGGSCDSVAFTSEEYGAGASGRRSGPRPRRTPCKPCGRGCFRSLRLSVPAAIWEIPTEIQGSQRDGRANAIPERLKTAAEGPVSIEISNKRFSVIQGKFCARGASGTALEARLRLRAESI